MGKYNKFIVMQTVVKEIASITKYTYIYACCFKINVSNSNRHTYTCFAKLKCVFI